MNWFKRVISNALSTLRTPQGWLIDAFGSNQSASGISVTDESAIQLSAVYSCVDRLSAGVASLPAITYRRLPDGGRERAMDFYIYDLLLIPIPSIHENLPPELFWIARPPGLPQQFASCCSCSPV